MSELIPIIAFGVGLVIGALAVWLILRAKAAGAASAVRAEIQPAVATLTERVNAKEQQIAQLQSALAAEEGQKTQLATQLQQESNASASAGEKSRQLEEQLRAQGEQVKEAQAALEAQRQQLAGVAERAGIGRGPVGRRTQSAAANWPRSTRRRARASSACRQSCWSKDGRMANSRRR